MAINRVNGQMLNANLARDGVDLSVETDLLYIDVINGRIGIKTATPSADFNLSGTALITGQLTVDNIVADSNTVTSTAGDLILNATSGNISANNNRILDCADPVGALDVVNLQTLTGALGGASAFQIISDDTKVIVLDDGINPGQVDVLIDTVLTATFNATELNLTTNLTTSGNVNAATGDIADINFITDLITSDTGTIGINATNINFVGDISLAGAATNRVLYVNGSGYVRKKPTLSFNDTTDKLTIDGIFQADDVYVDGNTVTGNVDSLNLTTTINGDIIATTGAGIVDLGSNAAMQLPSGTTAERPGTTATIITDLVVGAEYEVTTVGTSDFTTVGAALNIPGEIFTATGVGTGTGTATRTIQAGMTRWNETLGETETYDGTTWHVMPKYFDITSQQIVPDGISVNFTLDKPATTDSVLIIINGIVQDPQGGSVYSVSGTTLTMSVVLPVTDIISVRFLAA